MAQAAMMVVPSVLQGIGGIMSAHDEADAMDKQAKQLEIRGTEALATKQQEASIERKKGDKAISKFTALVGKSGGGGKGAADLKADLEGTKDFNSLAALFEGRSQQKAGYDQAAEVREQADLKKKNSFIQGFAGVLGSAASNYGKYGSGGIA